jgi:hypothetical protein
VNWVTFVGEGRSGHTVVSGILGSHPHIRISEEQKFVSKWYRAGWSKKKILASLHKSGVGKERGPQGWRGVQTYEEPLLAVGDKCGWDAVNEVAKRAAPSDILTRFGSHMDMPVKTIVSLRHPLDNISCWVQSPKYQRIYGHERLLYRRMIRRYKRFHDHALNVIEGQDVFYLHNEDLIENPSHTIQALSEWLELPNNRAWRRSCASLVFKKPNRRSQTLNWPEEYRERVMAYIDENPMLERYR